MRRRVRTGLEAASRLAASATSFIVVALAAIMVASLLLQVVFRFGFSRALSWSDEIALLSFIWITFLAGSLGVREAFHVRLTLALNLLPSNWQAAAGLVVSLLTIGFGLLLLIAGGEYVAMTADSISPAVGYPIELLHLAAPASGGLIMLHALARLVSGDRTDDSAELAV